MNICQVCGKGYCPNKARRFFGPLPIKFCSPTCVKLSHKAVAIEEEDETELLAEQICMTLNRAGYITDYDCDAVKLIMPLLKPS